MTMERDPLDAASGQTGGLLSRDHQLPTVNTQGTERDQAVRPVDSRSLAEVETPVRRLQVQATWDSEAGVWVASSSDVPGLVTEARTIEALESKLATLVPDLLLLNGVLQSGVVVKTVWIKTGVGGEAGDEVEGEVGSESGGVGNDQRRTPC